MVSGIKITTIPLRASYDNLVYPEFKGYHANMYWATFESDTAPFTVYSRTDGIFYRVFTPEEPKGSAKRTMPEFPEGDISFLLDIPAICSFKPIEQQGRTVSREIYVSRREMKGYV